MLDFIAVPFGYVMRFIYEGVGSYGLSIILFTLLTQIILLPFNWKQKKGMMDVQRIQPKMLELQKKYANNREKYAQEVQKLYDEEGVSPLSGCLPTVSYTHLKIPRWASTLSRTRTVTGSRSCPPANEVTR